jgi:signal transduction histidine kinase
MVRMLDALPGFKRHTVTGGSEMTAPRIIWLVLAGVAALWAMALGVPIWISALALTCAVLPAAAGLFLHGSATPSRTAEIEVSIWIGLATVGAASTGGAASPLIILFALALVMSWASGVKRLGAETAGFSLVGLAVASLAGANGTWLDSKDSDTLAMVFAVAAVAHLGAIAALGAVRPQAEGAQKLKPVINKDGVSKRPDPESLLKLRQLEARTRQAEAAIEAAQKELAEANARLDARTTFFAQTSHELRTPLNAIIGFSEMMQHQIYGPLPERYQEYANLIHEGGRNLGLIVDDVLDLSRIEAGRYDIRPELVGLGDLAAEAVSFMREEAARKQIELELAGDRDVEAFADSKAVRQIALNLISNGLKFTPAGGSVTVSTLDAPGGGALLAVSDTGEGISAEELQRLSRAIEQGEAGKKQKGTGLGLSVVRAFAELHGGRLDIESREGGGSTIAVYFPPEKNAG